MSSGGSKSMREEDDEQRLRERLKRRQESRRRSQSEGNPETNGEKPRDDSDGDDSTRDNNGDNRTTQQKRRDRRRRRERRRRSREERRNPRPPPGRYPPPPHGHHRFYGGPPQRGPPLPPFRGGPEGPRWERYGPSPHMRGYHEDHWRRGPPPMHPRGHPPPHWRGGPYDRDPRYPPARRSRSRSYSSRSRSRSRSRSYSSRSRSSSRSPRRRRSRSYSESSRSQYSDISRSDASVSASSSDESAQSPIEQDNALTKDQRTIFVSQLVQKAEQKDLRKYFRKKVGCKVNEVILLRDKRTGRHKGCAYVELGRLEDVPKAVQVSGIPPDFQRFPIMVKASEAEKNYIIPNTQATVTASMMGERGAAGPTLGPNGKLLETQKVYIGNLDHSVTQDQIYAVFSKFGRLDKVAIQMDPTTSTSRGFAFLSYDDAKVANLAIQSMTGQVLGGRSLKTGWANQTTAIAGVDVVTSTEFPENAAELIKNAQIALTQLARSATAAGSPDIPGPEEKTVSVPSPAPPPVVVDAKVIGHMENPTSSLLVHNMFDKDEETEQGWEEEIRLDFEEECSKYGKLRLIKVMSKEPGGKIFATFESITAAKNCASSLAGRWFDKRQLRVEFVSDADIPQ